MSRCVWIVHLLQHVHTYIYTYIHIRQAFVDSASLVAHTYIHTYMHTHTTGMCGQCISCGTYIHTHIHAYTYDRHVWTVHLSWHILIHQGDFR